MILPVIILGLKAQRNATPLCDCPFPSNSWSKKILPYAARLVMMICLGLSIWTAKPTFAEKPATEPADKPNITIAEEMTDAMAEQAARVKVQLQKKAKSLFERQPMGWDWQTIEFLYTWLLLLPLQLPQFLEIVIEQSRLLGLVGSLVVLTFLVALLYSLLGQKRVMAHAEAKIAPFQPKIPQAVYPFILSALRPVIATLFPLLLLGLFALSNAMIAYQAAWFQFIGKLLIVWAVGALLINLLRELLTRQLFEATARYGKAIFRLARLVVWYAMFGIALFWAAEAFHIRPDVLALLKFIISVSIVLVFFLLSLKKKALLSFLPSLPYASYQGFIRLLDRYYFPFIFFSLLLAFLWCIGYRQLGHLVLFKTWSTGAAYLAIMIAYHLLRSWLYKWYARTDPNDETAHFLFRSFKVLIVYVTVIAVALIVFNFLGLLELLRQVMSFPVFQLGKNTVTFWTILQAVLILLTFIYASRLLQAYLDYKVYPKIGIEPGLGYALNTSLKYSTIIIGFLISLKIVGLDLRFLLVFAGAAGIGIGLGLQQMAANVISGFSLIFGGKIRKGDWIEVSGTLGMVTDIYLRATKLRTRDNIEYLIPNTEFISGTIINYSLSSPLIRIAIPVGVAYDADPKQVEQILLAVAEKEPLVSTTQAPAVRFVEYGDSAINFELLVWIDVRTTPRRRITSNLYFVIFEELKKVGIEIPFPQRDIHIRSTVEQKK